MKHGQPPPPRRLLPAIQVAAIKSVAETSIVQLRAALKDARRATVARATALADALGVNPPKNLLARRVPNEHLERLVARDVTAGGCTYLSSPARVAKRSVTNAGGRECAKGGTSEGTAAGTDVEKQPHHQHRGDHGGPSSPVGGVDRALHSDESSKQVSSSPDTTGYKKDCSQYSSTPTTEAVAAERALGSSANLAVAGAGNRVTENSAPSASSSNAADRGWNREWCRSVDDWCRNASARFRSRVAGEVAYAARRLHWLAGSSGCRGCGGGASSSSRQRGGRCACGARMRRNGASAGGCDDRSMPSEKIGAEGWAALAAYGDVADLLEILESTAELTISVEVVSIDREPRLAQNISTLQLHDETGRSNATKSQDQGEGGAVTDEKVCSSGADKSLTYVVGESNSNIAITLSSSADHLIDEEKSAALALATAGGVVSTKGRESHPNYSVRVVTDHHQEPSLKYLQQYAPARAEPVSGKGFNLATDRRVPSSDSFERANEAADVVVGAKANHLRSVPRPPQLAAVDEKADIDTDSSSVDDREGAGLPETFARERDGFSRTSERWRESELDTGAEMRFRLDGEAEADDIQLGSGGCSEELQGSTRLGDLQRDRDRGHESTACIGGSRAPLATARIVLGPEEIETTLGVRPLSAFVLQAARWKKRHLSTPATRQRESCSVHSAQGSSLHLTGRAGAPGYPERAQCNVGTKAEVGVTTLVAREEREKTEASLEIGPASSTVRSDSNGKPLPLTEAPFTKGQAGACCMSATEKLGLACTVESLILPHLRLILRATRRRNTSKAGKASTLRLRLKVELSQVSDKQSARESKLDGAGPTAGAQQQLPEVERAAGTVASAGESSTSATSPVEPLSAAEGEAAETSQLITTATERNFIWTRRYSEAPVQRWVGRLDGRRCLLSCSAVAQYRIVGRPHCSEGGPSPRAAERLKGGWEAKRVHDRKTVGGDAGCTYATYTPVRSIGTVSDGDHPSPVEPKQYVLLGRAKGAQPPRALSGRPLCRNCGRHAFLRLVVSTDLLAQSPFCLSREASLLSTHEISCHAFPNQRDDGMNCALPPERYRLKVHGRGCRAAEKTVSRGRFGNWACRSGAILCDRCLGALRSAEVPLERIAATAV